MEKYTTEIVASEMHMLDSKAASGFEKATQQSSFSAQGSEPVANFATSPSTQSGPEIDNGFAEHGTDHVIHDDDIPF